MPLIRGLSLEQAITHLFDHGEDGLVWHAEYEAPRWKDDDGVQARYLCEIFENAGTHLSRFSDAQLEIALWYIITEGHVSNALSPSVSIDLRRALVRSTFGLYRDLFAVRCKEIDWGGDWPLYRVCYMFWEIFPLSSEPSDSDKAPLGIEMLATLERILGIDNLMCQYSALHGLGHEHGSSPAQVEAIIDRYLARHPEPGFELRDYALAARRGGVM